ncbi:hypothetical protein ABT112_26405 [Streptomyces sp. NPDC002055]|uniref:hypothetical protein n=1 Tax=Streptomyces sp. NPDC002055 TaxID=3154534 RepID=UPI0033280A0F
MINRLGNNRQGGAQHCCAPPALKHREAREGADQAHRAANVDPSRIIAIGQIENAPDTTDIEDLFSAKDYLWLCNRATGSDRREADLISTSNPTPILMRLKITREKRQQPGTLDRVRPAHELARDRDAFFEQVDDETLNRFEDVFKRLVS